MVFASMWNKEFLKGTVSIFLIGIAFALTSCATFQEEIQEEEVYFEETLDKETPIADAPLLQPNLPISKRLTETQSPNIPMTQATTSSKTDDFKDSPAYVLGPEDVIQVVVWKDDSLTRTVIIRPDGKISLPLVGEVHAAQLTPGELANEVRKSLKKYYLEQPEVSIIVMEINSLSFFVLGEVVIPGKHILRRETTVLQALSLVGGFKEYADTKNILLLRREGSIEKRIKINYKNLVSGANQEDNLFLKAGDTLIVP